MRVRRRPNNREGNDFHGGTCVLLSLSCLRKPTHKHTITLTHTHSYYYTNNFTWAGFGRGTNVNLYTLSGRRQTLLCCGADGGGDDARMSGMGPRRPLGRPATTGRGPYRGVASVRRATGRDATCQNIRRLPVGGRPSAPAAAHPAGRFARELRGALAGRPRPQQCLRKPVGGGRRAA